MIVSKQREISQSQKDLATTEKKIADLETKIVQKQKILREEENRLLKEEEKDRKKLEDQQKRNAAESEKRAKEHITRMNRIDTTIAKHDSIHKDTLSALERLQRLPEQIVVLFLASNPADQQQLRLDEEARSITEMIRKAKHRDSIQFETRWAVQPMNILQAINELNPKIVHFSGHGSDADEIIFQSSSGGTKAVSKEAIVQTMMASSDSIRLVFFNTCYSFNQAEAVTNHVEAAIGMNTSIGDEAARVFASQFYSAIGFGLSLKKSFEQAKAMIMLEGIQEENTPELFVQAGLTSEEIVIVRPNI